MINNSNINEILDNWSEHELKDWFVVRSYNTLTGETRLICAGLNIDELAQQVEMRVKTAEFDYGYNEHVFYNICYMQTVYTCDEFKQLLEDYRAACKD